MKMHDNARWVSTREGCESPLIYGTFDVPSDNKKCEIAICGLGFFELYINGKRVSDDIFVPAWTDYESKSGAWMLYPSNDITDHRIYYLVYDLMPYITEGENKIEILLGNGWYNQHERNVEGDQSYGKPKAIFTIEMTDSDGNVSYRLSDSNLKYKPSHIVFNNVYYGETHDYTIKSDEKSVALVIRPETVLFEQTCPADKEYPAITPKVIAKIGEETIYDCGNNISGYACVSGTGHIVIRYAEEINEDVCLDFRSTGGEGQIQKDEYTTENGVVRTLKPSFSWKAFRYIGVTGDINDISIIPVHCKIDVISEFESSSPVLNWLYDAYIRTQENNTHAGVVSDCPHRERLGYTGDGQLACSAAMTVFDSSALYKKWIYDILDCQDIKTGHVQHTAPFYGGGGGPGGWGGAIVIVPYMYYKHFGDAVLISECWYPMMEYISYMEKHSQNGLVVSESEGGWCLGDWCTLDDVVLPEPLVNTYYLIKCMRYMKSLHETTGIGTKSDIAYLDGLIYSSAKAMYDTYHGMCMVQGAEAFLADLVLLTEDEVKALSEKYDKLGHYDTGIFGTYVLTHVLFDYGYTDIAYKLLSSEDEGSFGYMMNKGATTIWEEWPNNPHASHDHPMFGGVVDTLFEDILGIHPDSDEITPHIPSELSYVKGKAMSKSGPVIVEYKDGKISITR